MVPFLVSRDLDRGIGVKYNVKFNVFVVGDYFVAFVNGCLKVQVLERASIDELIIAD